MSLYIIKSTMLIEQQLSLTLGRSCSSQMVDGPEDQPEGPLLVAADPQHLHGRLQLGKLLGGALLILGLAGRHTFSGEIPF